MQWQNGERERQRQRVEEVKVVKEKTTRKKGMRETRVDSVSFLVEVSS